MRQLLNLEDEAHWNTEIEPTSNAIIDRIPLDVKEGIATAFASRAELRQQTLRIDNAQIERRFQQNLARPRLDFQARYGYNGLGGDVVLTEDIFDPNSPTITIPGGYSDAMDQVLNQRFQGWSAGVVFAYPLQNRAGKASVAISELALEESEAALEDLELTIKTEVRRTLRAVETAAEAIDLATISRELAEQNLDAEEKRYENGLSTSFQVLEIQEDLSEARSREVSSIAAYRRALVLYFKATGRLLEENNVVMEDDLIQGD